MGRAVGIDLGTTNSVIAATEGGQPQVIPNAEGNRTTPSVVAFTGERRAAGRPDGPATGDPEPEGDDLLREALHRPQVRRGQQRDDHRLLRRRRRPRRRGPLRGQRQAVRTRGDLGAGAAQAGRRRRQVPRRAGHRGGDHRAGVLQRRAASGDQGRRPDRRTRGPPDHQRADRCRPRVRAWTSSRTRPCWSSTSAAARSTSASSTVGDGVVEVRSTAGDTHLGGDDFDRRIVDHLADDFKKSNGIDLRDDPQALQRLFEAAEKAKVELSAVTQTAVNLPFVTADASGPKHLNVNLMRSTFEQLTADLVERCLGPVKQAMEDAKVTADDIDEVILVGGSTQDPGRAGPGTPPDRWQGTEHDRQPGRGRGHRRGRPGGDHQGRRQGRAAARRHAPVAWAGDDGRRDDQSHRPQHHHPGCDGPRSSAPPRTTSPPSTSSSSRASGSERPTTACWAGSGWRTSVPRRAGCRRSR